MGTELNKTLRDQVQTEVDASWLYSRLAEKEEDGQVAEIFRKMSLIETEHAQAFEKWTK